MRSVCVCVGGAGAAGAAAVERGGDEERDEAGEVESGETAPVPVP